MQYECLVDNVLISRKLDNNNDFWIKFDEQRFLIHGKATQDSGTEFTVNTTNKRFSLTATLIIMALDPGLLNASASFRVQITNDAPQIVAPTLYQQFRKKYKSLPVLTKFELTIDKSTFVDPDEDDLTYELRLMKNGVEMALPQWIEFDQFSLSLRGTPQNLGEKLTFVLAAKDAYFETTQSVTLKVTFSFNYFLKIVSQIIGPLTFLVTLVQYKGFLFAVICKRKYKQLPVQYVCLNNRFYMTIPIIGDYIEFYARVWQTFTNATIARNPTFGCTNFFRYFLSESLEVCKVAELEHQINEALRQERDKSPAQPPTELPAENGDSSKAPGKPTPNPLQFVFNGGEFKYVPNFDEVRGLSSQNVFLNMLIWQEIFIQNEHIVKIYSSLNKELQASLPDTLFYLQKYVYNVEYQPVEELEKNIFPKVHFSDWILKFDISNVRYKYFIMDDFFDHYPSRVFTIIKYKIISEILGLSPHRLLQSQYGIALQARPQEVSLITSKVYQENQKKPSCVDCILGFLKLNLVFLGLSQMRHLPKWLKVDLKYNSIVLYGTPKTMDIPKLIVQVFSADLIIMEFLLEIVQDKENKIRIDQKIEKRDKIGNIITYNQNIYMNKKAEEELSLDMDEGAAADQRGQLLCSESRKDSIISNSSTINHAHDQIINQNDYAESQKLASFREINLAQSIPIEPTHGKKLSSSSSNELVNNSPLPSINDTSKRGEYFQSIQTEFRKQFNMNIFLVDKQY